MDEDRYLTVLRIVIPIVIFIAVFALLTVITPLHWAVSIVLAVAAGALDVFVFYPMTEKSVADSIRK